MNWIFSAVTAIVLSVKFLFVPAFAESYTITSENGYVVVREESGETVRTEVRVSMLPEADRARLENGIECGDERELAKVMENFCS